MTSLPVRTVVVGLAMLLIGYAAGQAQSGVPPDFELTVEAPEGETVIECVRGCELQWVQRGLIPGNTPMLQFRYACKGAPRCGSGRIGGWIRP